MSGKIFRYSVKEPSFSLIRDGIKKIEGRLFKNTFCQINPGHYIIFYNRKDNFKVRVNVIKNYNNFRDMLVSEGIKLVTPLSNSLNESISIYRRLYSIEDEKKYGVIAIHVENI